MVKGSRAELGAGEGPVSTIAERWKRPGSSRARHDLTRGPRVLGSWGCQIPPPRSPVRGPEGWILAQGARFTGSRGPELGVWEPELGSRTLQEPRIAQIWGILGISTRRAPLVQPGGSLGTLRGGTSRGPSGGYRGRAVPWDSHTLAGQGAADPCKDPPRGGQRQDACGAQGPVGPEYKRG